MLTELVYKPISVIETRQCVVIPMKGPASIDFEIDEDLTWCLHGPGVVDFREGGADRSCL